MEQQIKEVLVELAEIDKEVEVMEDTRHDIEMRNLNLKIEFLSIMTQIYL